MSNNPGTYLDALLNKNVQANTVPQTPRPAINFGSGFTVADNPSNGSTDVTATGSAPITFASLAALVPGGVHATVNLDCYATVGDQGGGRFHWDASSTATPDGGQVSYGAGNTNPAVAGRWVRDVEAPSYFNIRNYGASPGNSAATNTTAINAALTACSAAGGGTVLVPPGTFLVNANLIAVPSFVSLLGLGYSGNASIFSCGQIGRTIQTGATTLNGANVGTYGSISNIFFKNTAVASVGKWAPGTAYTVGQMVRPKATNATCQGKNVNAISPRIFVCTQNGTSGSFQPIATLFAQGGQSATFGSTPPPAIKLINSGSIANDNLVDIQILSFGSGSGTFQWTATNVRNNVTGGTWTGPVSFTLGQTVALGASGYSAVFAASGTYVVNQVYRTPTFKWTLNISETAIQDGTAQWAAIDGAVAIDDFCGGNIVIDRCQFTGHTIDIIFDGTVLAEVRYPVNTTSLANIWVVNGGEHVQGRPGVTCQPTSVLSTNMIRVDSPQFATNADGVAVIDDGGTNHKYSHCNVNSGGAGFAFALVQQGSLNGGDLETSFKAVTFSDISYFGVIIGGTAYNFSLNEVTFGGAAANVDGTAIISARTITGLQLERNSFSSNPAISGISTMNQVTTRDNETNGGAISGNQCSDGGMAYYAGRLGLGAFAYSPFFGSAGKPIADLEVSGQVAFRQLTWSVTTPITSNFNAFRSTNGASVPYTYVEISVNTTNADFAFDGFGTTSGTNWAFDGALLFLGNSDTHNMSVIPAAKSASAVGNKILLPDNLSYATVGPGGWMLFEYDTNASAWRLRSWTRTAQVALAVSATGTSTASTAALGAPTVYANSTALTGNATLAFGGVVGIYDLDLSAVTLNGHAVTLTNGAGTFTATTLLGTKTLLRVYCNSTGTINAG